MRSCGTSEVVSSFVSAEFTVGRSRIPIIRRSVHTDGVGIPAVALNQPLARNLLEAPSVWNSSLHSWRRWSP
jgi:hypothetical protein